LSTMIKTLHFLVLSLSVIRALGFSCSFVVANGEARDCQGGLWWGRDSKAKRGGLVVAG
nr:hypothetical protein [Tanacetum cinerariifolium]